PFAAATDSAPLDPQGAPADPLSPELRELPWYQACRFVVVSHRRARFFHGTCTTKLMAGNGGRPVLAFIDHWRQGKRELTGGWIVTLRHDLRVLGVRTTGTSPPQPY